MVVSINQPAYLPWLGYLDRIARSDLHVVLDDVQFEKNSYVNRNKVRTKDGWCWLTVPVQTKGKFGDLPINQLEVADDTMWCHKHYETFRMNYARADYFDAHAPFLTECYRRPWRHLLELMNFQSAYLRQAFSIQTPIVYSSSLSAAGRKDELVLNICRAVGATHYLSGPLGTAYIREEIFRDASVTVSYHRYSHPTYQQAFPGFEQQMTAFDLLLNHGPASKAIMAGSSTSPLN